VLDEALGDDLSHDLTAWTHFRPWKRKAKASAAAISDGSAAAHRSASSSSSSWSRSCRSRSAPPPNLLARLGPAILWIAALFASLLGLDRLFQANHEDGSLDFLVTGSLPLEVAVLIKCAAHWTVSALPLIVVSPLFGLMLAMTQLPLMPVAAALAAGTPPLAMIGAIGAALTVPLRRGGLLMAVLILPLTIPVLIFGVAAASAASSGAAPFLAPFLTLCARRRSRALRRRRGAAAYPGVTRGSRLPSRFANVKIFLPSAGRRRRRGFACSEN
jgi:heme exporter protein B